MTGIGEEMGDAASLRETPFAPGPTSEMLFGGKAAIQPNKQGMTKAWKQINQFVAKLH